MDEYDHILSMNESNHLTTREAAALVGVHDSSIKRWCDSGNLACSLTTGGHRRINLDELLDFAGTRGMACSLLDFGEAAPDVWWALTQARDAADFEPLGSLAFRWLDAAEDHLPGRLLSFLVEQEVPLESIFDHLVAPVMQRVGVDWQDGYIEVGDEHRMVQVVVDAMEELRRTRMGERTSSTRTALIGCGEASQHDLGARMVRALLDMAGWRTIFLGARVPTTDFALQQRKHRASLVCISLAQPHVASDAERVIRVLARFYREDVPYRLALGGSAFSGGLESEITGCPFVGCRTFASLEPFVEWNQVGD
jgi:MerR family transcriptional regulator, light-induced transcriptional regulator